LKIYLDTNIVIYLVERNLTWFSRVTARLTLLRASGDRMAVGDLTRAECLVGPFISGNISVENAYKGFFGDPDVDVLPITAAACERAARIRAGFGFDLADALHLATAIEHGCGAFLTNDARLTRCKEIAVELIC
jgi:uncharacterized protein